MPALAAALWLFGWALAVAAPPGVVIDHSAAASGIYIGSPSLAVLPNGDYVASHDEFGPKSTEQRRAVTRVFASHDRGQTWAPLARIDGQFWSTLFAHQGALYLIGTDRHHGNAIIRRSTDGGRTWTNPANAQTGLLRDNGEYHCAPMPVIEHAGLLWRGMERRDPPIGWGVNYCAGMLSAPADADLLDAANWTFSNFLHSDTNWLDRGFGGWLEGNAVVGPEGGMLDILRVETPGFPEKAALVQVSADGRAVSFDPQTGFVDFPGGAKKFTIRYDPHSRLYWSLATIVTKEFRKAGRPGGIRNTLALVSSADLRSWSVRSVLLSHPDTAKHGFQYVDWLFEGDDIIAACRTAYDDDQGGAHNNHDANYLTFHRIKNFREHPVLAGGPGPSPGSFTNSLGMKMIRVEAGRFRMGSETGEVDERPVHTVRLTQPFWMAATEVSNLQYEQFDPSHKALRGKRGISKDDDEAVVFVSWEEARRFCTWLSQKEGRAYSLPTEAEWEYACRAGTTGAYSTGDMLPANYWKAQEQSWDPKPVSLRVGATPPNPWGFFDLHGNVEEWCRDTYGPYLGADQMDPAGYAVGDMKVTRGGSHNTELTYLRSANRSGTLPDDKSWLIGFRVVSGGLPSPPMLPMPPVRLWAAQVSQAAHPFSPEPENPASEFQGPTPFIRPPPHPELVPLFPHNHCPTITWCDNGDLLVAWFSTREESGREMTILASRLRPGQAEWDDAAEFFKAPDRNMTGSALLNDGKGKLYHFNGLEAASGWANLALVMRTSTDNGATWSRPRLIDPEHQPRNQVISGTLTTREGFLIQPCDAVSGGNGGTAIHVSRDGGATWSDPGAGTPKPQFKAGNSGGTIAGIHAGVVQLSDGSLMALGRGDRIDGHMPRSLSRDMGAGWIYSASEFPPLSSGQRLVLRRLRQGPLLLVSFTDPSDLKSPKGLEFGDAAGKAYLGYGMFAALSFDEGQTWPVRKLITDGKPTHALNGGAWTRDFMMDPTHAEPKGYLAATQTPDGTIHLVSSALYYRFNLAWLKQPAAAVPGK